MSRGHGKPNSGSPPSPSGPFPREVGAGAERRSDPEIETAVRALQAGRDESAAQLLFRRFFPVLEALFLRLGEGEEARDHAQETLVNAFQKITQFRFESSFETWLRRSATNRWLNLRRRRRTEKHRIDADAVALDPAVLDEHGPAAAEASFHPRSLGDPEVRTLNRERSRELVAAFDRLPPRQRRVAVLRLTEGLSYAEIAEREGVEVGTVKSQVHDARKNLRSLLETYFGGTDI